jgi:hypothetical protein
MSDTQGPADPAEVLRAVLRTSLDLAAASRISTDVKTADVSWHAAERLLRTARSVLNRGDMPEADRVALDAECDRLSAVLNLSAR